MMDNFEQKFAEQIRELDQNIEIDAANLTSRLTAVRNQRRYRRSKYQALAGIATGCLLMLAFAIRLLPGGHDQTSVATKAVDTDQEPVFHAEFEFPADFTDQKAELRRLKARIDELKRTSRAQQLTLVRESVSRKMFPLD
jgi:hypothetical protein